MSALAAVKRVGHKGADLIAPGNTRESFDAALAAGVDMIEFDILPARGSGELILAHDYRDLERRPPLSLAEGLEHLASGPFSGVELDVDLKLPGYELDVVGALREFGLIERTLISTQYRESLALIRAAEPALRLGWSVPRLRQDPFRNPLMWIPASAVVVAWRRALPRWAAGAIRRGECDALMSHWRLVSSALVRAVAQAGGELYVWTVDDLPRIRQLERMGVTGVITNDPRLFSLSAEGATTRRRATPAG
jgi:glycerophosphoryl diester phosphodiesterase